MVKHTHGSPRSVESPNVPIEMAENHEYIYVYIYIYDYIIKLKKIYIHMAMAQK